LAGVSMFFDGWNDILRMAVVGVPVYAVLLMMLRVTGKRALAKMNAFDLVVTIALGSTLASTLLTDDVSLSEGLFAFALLLGLQYLVTLGTLHFPLFRRMVTEQPRLLVYRGEMLDDAMRTERISAEEIEAGLRAAGHMSMDEVHAVILENDGSFSIIPNGADLTPSAMENVKNFPPDSASP
jgi:uncharacterized membrane protein YcaP (DUF421 family)